MESLKPEKKQATKREQERKGHQADQAALEMVSSRSKILIVQQYG
jgi:6,7-dimethyl-8-ribityllumazine synthase